MKFQYLRKTFDIESISSDDHILKTITKNKCFYELDLLEYMRLVVKRNSEQNTIAIDVGANIGNHSIFMRSFLANHLIAIEPNTIVLPFLHRNLSQNISDYSVYECALGEHVGSGRIAMPTNAKNNIGMARVMVDDNIGGIEITTLDKIVDTWEQSNDISGCINVIKIDVEGMELGVLKGAEMTIRKHKPSIFAEAATARDLCQLNNYLQTIGYNKISVWGATPVYHFAYSPGPQYILRARIAEYFTRLRRKIARFRTSLTKKISGLGAWRS